MAIAPGVVPLHAVIGVCALGALCQGQSGTDRMSGVGERHDLGLTARLDAFNREVDNVRDGDAAPFTCLRIPDRHVPGAEKCRDELAPPRHWSPHTA